MHGDHCTTAGSVTELLWFKKRLEKTYEINTRLIGPRGEGAGKVLNRIITFTGDGFELEADPRHSEMIVEQLGVSGSGGITTAGCQNEEVESLEHDPQTKGRFSTFTS